VQINEAELDASEAATYKQRLEVLQQQQELIEDEAEQEQASYPSHHFMFGQN
jgi:LETM1 and EF-hand domain-containing protein 1